MTECDPKTGAEILTWLSQAVTVGVGWYVVHKLSAARDRDKARREMIAKSADALIADLTDLLVVARSYHASAREVGTELRLKSELQDMSMRAGSISQISKDAATLSACRADIASLRRAITGQHFEDEHLGPLPESGLQYQEIADAVLRAKLSLTKVKHAQFPPD